MLSRSVGQPEPEAPSAEVLQASQLPDINPYPMSAAADIPPDGIAGRVGQRVRKGAGSRPLVLILITAISLAVAAIAVGRDFVSPQQQAAQAAPPKASVITAKIGYGTLSATAETRADIAEVHPTSVGVPSDLAGAQAVVTSLKVKAGSTISNGEELLTVAERPVFAFTGSIPAFRDIVPGTNGVDVSQLQAGLRAAGYGTGGDSSGTYGVGTENAIRQLYAAAHVPVALTSPDADHKLASLATAITTAGTALRSAQNKLSQDQRAGKSSELAADRSTVNGAQTRLTKAQQALTTAQQTIGVTVPSGEVVFVPRLPEQLVQLKVHAGSTASSGLAQIGSGTIRLTAQVDGSTQAELRAGMAATATVDQSGATFPLTVSAVAAQPTTDAQGIPSYKVTFAPSGSVSASLVGQNVAVQITISSSDTSAFYVPVSAISTSSSGQTYITVLGKKGPQQEIQVSLGLSTGGSQAITPLGGAELFAGEAVVVGSAS